MPKLDLEQLEQIYGEFAGSDDKIEQEIVRLVRQEVQTKNEKRATAKAFREIEKDIKSRIEYLISIHGKKVGGDQPAEGSAENPAEAA